MGLLDTLKSFFSPTKTAEKKSLKVKEEQKKKKEVVAQSPTLLGLIKQRLKQKTYTKPGAFKFEIKPETQIAPGVKTATAQPGPTISKVTSSEAAQKKLEEIEKVSSEQKGLLPYIMPETLQETQQKLAVATTLREKLGITAFAGLSLIPMAPELKGAAVFSKIAPKVAKLSKAEDIYKVIKPLFKGKTNEEIKLASETLKNITEPAKVVNYLTEFSKIKPVEVLPEAKAISKVEEVLPIKPSIVKQEFRADKLNLGTEGTAKIEADRARLGLTERKVRSVDEVRAIAEEIGSDPQKLLKEVQSGRITDSEVVALRDTIATNTDYVIEQSKLLESPALTKREKELLQLKINKAQEVIDRGLNKLVVGGTEAGRAVASYKILANKTLDPVFWQTKALRLSGKKSLDAPILKAIDELTKQKDRLGLAKLMMEVKKATPTEKIITLWKAGLLTSPTTHLANIGGNLSMTILENIAQAPAAAIDKLISLRTGRRTKTGLSGSRLLEQLKGAKKGISEAGDYMKYGVSEAERLKWDIPRQVNYNNKVLQGYTQSIFRSLGAEDKVFKQAKIADSLLEQAKVALKNKDDVYKYATDALKKEGKELTDKNVVKFLVENPLDEMGLIAINDAEYITFQSENVLAKMFSGAKKGARQQSEFAEGVLDFIVPFSKTPSNVAARIVDFSPAGLVKTIFGQLKKENRFWGSREAQKAFSEMMGRGITGTGIIALGAYLATKGLITGAYPTDPTERMLWEQEGKQSNSIFIGGKWRNMDKISPVGNLLTLGAKYTEHQRKGAGGLDLISKTTASGVKGLTEQTFLQGLSGALGAVSDPERGAAKYTRQAVASVVPTIIGKMARIADPVKREQVRWWEGAQVKVPFLSKMLPEKLDDFGQQQLWENGTFGWRALFDPFISREAKDTVLTGELRRLWENDYKVKPTELNASTSVGGVKIQYSQDELNVLKSAIGNVWLKILTEAVSSPKYDELSDYDKQKALRGIIGDIKEEIVKANPPYGTGILRKAGVKFEDTPEKDVLNTIMIEVIETPEWKKMTDDDREKLVKSLYVKLLEKGITGQANSELQ